MKNSYRRVTPYYIISFMLNTYVLLIRIKKMPETKNYLRLVNLFIFDDLQMCDLLVIDYPLFVAYLYGQISFGFSFA